MSEETEVHGILPSPVKHDREEPVIPIVVDGTKFNPISYDQYLENELYNIREKLFDILFPEEGSNLCAHARRELRLAGLLESEEEHDRALAKAVMELVRVFAAQQHSGFSARIVLDLFKEVANFRTLTKNDHSLYQDVSEAFGAPPGTHLQDIRDSRWFSKDSGKTWYNVEHKSKPDYSEFVELD